MAICELQYDLIIVGAGPAGITAALYADYFGLNFLIIDKEEFPRDKVCGDAIAPVVFSLFRELNLEVREDVFFHRPLGFDFVFSKNGQSKNFFNSHEDNGQMYNCKRIDFDNLLFSFVKKDKTFMKARVKKILQEDHLIVVEKNKREELLTFKKLIVATGSGKSIFPELRKEDESVLYASRAYVKSDFVFNKNMASFSDDIKPGYFWVFPVGDNLYNTGVLLHSAQKYNSIYDIHKMKLTEFFNSFEMVSHTRWPLRIYSHKPFFMMEDITCIGDANHSIDPLLGHGIDTGMLEAREQVIALVTTSRFAQTSAILKLVDKKNKLSFDYKKRIFSQSTAEKRLEIFLEFLVFLNKYYAEINTSLESSKISLTQKLKVKRQYNEHSNSIRRILNMFKKQ